MKIIEVLLRSALQMALVLWVFICMCGPFTLTGKEPWAMPLLFACIMTIMFIVALPGLIAVSPRIRRAVQWLGESE